MMRPTRLVPLIALLAGCASIASLRDETESERMGLWTGAQQALAQDDFDRAQMMFVQLSEEFEGTLEGRESLFYLGVIRLDPRNPDFDSEIAEARFAEYLSFTEEGGPRVYRYPEAYTFHEIARELNLPPDSRVAVLRPEERVITIEEPVLVPAERSRELMSQIEQLRREVATRDSTIKAQQEELERIRRTLIGPGRS